MMLIVPLAATGEEAISRGFSEESWSGGGVFLSDERKEEPILPAVSR